VSEETLAYVHELMEPTKPQPAFDGRGKPIDYVNHPPHYTAGKVECIDAIEAATVNKSGIEAVCVGNVLKYLWRYEQKDGLQSVEKARWYLDRLAKHLQGETP
jgi:hypothetical protein